MERGSGRARSFFAPISLWRVLCEWSAVVTAPLLLPSSHDLSLHMQFRHSRQSTVVACHHLFFVDESDRQKATFSSSERSSKALIGQCLNILESVAALEAHGLQRYFCLLFNSQDAHSNKASMTFGASVELLDGLAFSVDCSPDETYAGR